MVYRYIHMLTLAVVVVVVHSTTGRYTKECNFQKFNTLFDVY